PEASVVVHPVGAPPREARGGIDAAARFEPRLSIRAVLVRRGDAAIEEHDAGVELRLVRPAAIRGEIARAVAVEVTRGDRIAEPHVRDGRPREIGAEEL